MALYFSSVIWVMAFQNFAQKHSKSEMLFLLLFCLSPLGTACSAVLCRLYLCVGDAFPEAALCELKSCFHLLPKRKEKENIFNFISCAKQNQFLIV